MSLQTDLEALERTNPAVRRAAKKLARVAQVIVNQDAMKVPEMRAFRMPNTVASAIFGGASSDGYHATIAPWICPELFRLKMIGWRPPSSGGSGEITSLDPRTIGSLWHGLHEAEFHGFDPIKVLNNLEDLPGESHDKLETMWRAYRLRWRKDTWKPLFCEGKIRVPILDKPVKRLVPETGEWVTVLPTFTVRYDLIARGSKQIILVERKTTAALRTNDVFEWRTNAQIISQVWAARKHPWFKKHGLPYHTIMDFAIKTKAPDFAREPVMIGPEQLQAFEADLLKWTYDVRPFYERAYGYSQPWPRTWACHGRYSACDMLAACHFGVGA